MGDVDGSPLRCAATAHRPGVDFATDLEWAHDSLGCTFGNEGCTIHHTFGMSELHVYGSPCPEAAGLVDSIRGRDNQVQAAECDAIAAALPAGTDPAVIEWLRTRAAAYRTAMASDNHVVGEYTVLARDLTTEHIGLETYLPGILARPDFEWIDTWSPITMITHTRRGVVKVRRPPDGHVDHTLHPNMPLRVRRTQ